jgi:hypothetical protein
MNRVSWLNLHVVIPIRDVRCLIYAHLDTCDHEVVEMAHGVRKKISFQRVLFALRKGYTELVQYFHKHDKATGWQWPDIGTVLLEFEDSKIILWYAERFGDEYKTWAVHAGILHRCIMRNHNELLKVLLLRYGWGTNSSVYLDCATANNLSLAKWYYHQDELMEYHTQVAQQAYHIFRALLNHKTPEFYVWAKQHLELEENLKQNQLALARQKWPELKRVKRIKL